MQAEAWSGSRRTWRGLHELAGLRQARAAADHDARVRRAVRRAHAPGQAAGGGRGNVRRDRPRADDLRMAGAVTLRVAVSLFRERHHRSRCGDQARDAVLPVLRRPRGQPLGSEDARQEGGAHRPDRDVLPIAAGVAWSMPCRAGSGDRRSRRTSSRSRSSSG